MRIAHVSMFYLPTFGGVEQVIYELAKRQVAEGHEVHVFCGAHDKNKKLKIKEEILDGIYIHRIPTMARLSLNTFVWPGLISKLLKFEKDFDIVHSHVSGRDYILFTGIICKIRNWKHIHTTHCPWTGMEFRPKILWPFIILNDLFFNKFSYKFIDKIVEITPWEEQTIKKYLPEEKFSKIVFIPNGMDEIFYKRIKNNSFRKKYKIKEKYLILFFGRLNPTKGPEKLAQVAVNISKKRKDIAFVFVGPDEGKEAEVKSIVNDYKNIKVLGPIRGREKIAEMYQSADVYILPSYREGLPLTLFEAMASGLPIVASPVNGIPYEMKEKENGLFSDYGDLESLEKNILDLIDNPQLRKKFSENNIKKSKSYDWNLICKKYMKEYKYLLNYNL